VYGHLATANRYDIYDTCACVIIISIALGHLHLNGIAAVQELSSTEFKELSQSTPGYGVLVSGDKVLLLDTTMGKENPLYKAFSTNFHENASSSDAPPDGKKEGKV
jgi:hypothetical protein